MNRLLNIIQKHESDGESNSAFLESTGPVNCQYVRGACALAAERHQVDDSVA